MDIYYGTTKHIHFDYDPMGNRIAKHVILASGTESTYYTLDAQGNQMSVYTRQPIDNKLYLSEQNIYGSSRVGQEQMHTEMVLNPTTNGSSYATKLVMGDKRYELTNHLGNVLEVITDRKLASNGGSGSIVSYYTADVVSYSDYEPFGMALHGKNDGDYRYGFQGQEGDDEVKGDGNSVNYKFRMHDPRVGRFFTADPLTKNYPGHSPYSFSLNCVINGVELEGLEYYYTADGTFLGKVGTSQYVRVIKDNDVQGAKAGLVALYLLGGCDSKYATNLKAKIQKECLDVNAIKTEKTITQVLAFAAVIDNESSGSKEESYAIANVTMNFIEDGGSSTLNSLEDVTMYDNSFAQGATQENYTNFRKKSPAEQNAKFAVGAALNAICNNKNIAGFSDYSNGANSWDGIDLVDSKRSNSHRGYTWSEESKALLSTYKSDNNGGVNVANFNYSNTNFEIEAVKIVGKTLYTTLHTGRGERKQNETKFVTP